MPTDNHNLEAKLELRRVALRAFKRPLRVLDCFAGEQVIWDTLRRELKVADYLSFDLKPKRGRLKLDSLRFLQGQRWAHNVIDLDAYGSPWSHWVEVLKRRIPCCVFLTIGTGRNGRNTKISFDAIELAGMPLNLPFGMHCGLLETVNERCLGACFRHGMHPRAAWEALNPGGNARYLAVILEPVAAAAPAPQPTAEKIAS
jgi:hypothetical protein